MTRLRTATARQALRLAFILMFGVIAVRSTAGAASVSIAWEPSATIGVTNYIVRFWRDGASVVNTAQVGTATNHTIHNLDAGRWHCQVSAQSAQGIESDPSNLLVMEVPPAPVIRINLQGSGNITGPWTNIVSAGWSGELNGIAFYRGAVEVRR